MTPNAAFVANNKSIKYRPRKIPTFKVGERSQIYQISFLYLSGRDDPDSLPPTKNRAMNELNKVRTIQDIIIIIVIIIVGVVAYIFFLKKSCSSFLTPVTCTQSGGSFDRTARLVFELFRSFIKQMFANRATESSSQYRATKEDSSRPRVYLPHNDPQKRHFCILQTNFFGTLHASGDEVEFYEEVSFNVLKTARYTNYQFYRISQVLQPECTVQYLYYYYYYYFFFI